MNGILKKHIVLIFVFVFCLLLTNQEVHAAKYKYVWKTVATKKYLGKYKITHYCPCNYCGGGLTATGTKPKVGRTIAVDPRVIPYGSKVKIGKQTYIAEDCGGAIKGKKIDIFCKSHSEALKKGIKYQKVWLIKKKKKKVKVKINKKITTNYNHFIVVGDNS